MSRSYFTEDCRRVISGIIKVTNSGVSNQQAKCETIAKNSTVLKAVQGTPEVLRKNFPSDFRNLVQRASMVPRGIQQFAEIAPKYMKPKFIDENQNAKNSFEGFSQEVITIREEDLEDIYMKSLGVEVLHQNEDGKRFEEHLLRNDHNVISSPQRVSAEESLSLDPQFAAGKARPLTNVESHVSKKSSKTYKSSNLIDGFDLAKTGGLQNTTSERFNSLLSKQHQEMDADISNIKPLSRTKPTSQLSATSKQRKVPATRISRLVTFGGLAAGLGIGTLTEITKRSLGLSDPKKGNSLLESSPFLTEANAERIVDTLCRVRGAALKIGQILSIQDNSMMNPQLQKIFERVRHSADFMPSWQMEKMMVGEFGVDWKSKVLEFDDKPFAAASIGQVHLGKLHDGRAIAIKIQYPGVGQGIESDIDNLMSVLNVWNILPEGIFIDKVVEVAKRELSWEVDYVREAKCAKRFRELLLKRPDYYVPEVIDGLSTKQIYTTELIEGMAVDRCDSLDQETRDRICFLMLDLFFSELFEFQFMQTDPNWSNFLYNTETKQIGLLDFGASREYRNGFVDNYMRILKGAADNNKDVVLNASRDIGFLTGYESKAMENAHIETVMILGEALRIGNEKYDFGSQDLTLKIQRLVPVMVNERLCPPPEEIYSLHRKLSGVFLLCSRLKGRVQCQPIFDRVLKHYTPGRPDA